MMLRQLSISLKPTDSRRYNLKKKPSWVASKVLFMQFRSLEYLKKVKGKLEESGKADRVPVF